MPSGPFPTLVEVSIELSFSDELVLLSRLLRYEPFELPRTSKRERLFTIINKLISLFEEEMYDRKEKLVGRLQQLAK